MAERRALADGLKAADPIKAKEEEFVYGARGAAAQETAPATPPLPAAPPVQGRVPISTRMRADLATALKRASLERQLAGVEPNTLQDILEEAIEPWLRANGYLA
ncbi:hypothetical protein [Singulisphaera sp. PoT]|uniref:hypothetical protein n=1 Tax=Singulisphaera sp. PoT TaxID=3411797 RepID=UPI003BF5121A